VRAGERPPGHWRETTAHEVASAIRTLIQGGGVTPALRVVWDAIGDWLAAQLSGRCGELLDALRPEELDASIVVGLLGATYRARAQIPQRTSFRRAARAALLARGRTPAELDRLLGAQEDTQ